MTFSPRQPRFGSASTIVVMVALAGFAAVSATRAEAKPAAVAGGASCMVDPQPPAGTSTPFDGVCDYLSTREGVVQAAIYDGKKDQTYTPVSYTHLTLPTNREV